MKCILLFFSIINGKQLRLLGGRNAGLDEYPYIVRMEVQTVELSIKSLGVVLNAHVCTCAAITPIWTLTAAHCISKLEKVIPDAPIKAVIRYGSVQSNPGNNNSFSDILSYVKHPSYKKYSQRFMHLRSDIGLLRTQPIKLQQYGKVSAVDYSTLIGHQAVVVGFGLTDSSEQNVSTTLFLKKPLQVTTIVIKKCEKEALSSLFPVICVAGPCGKSVSLCPGDSGGPLVHASGIVAFNSMAALTDCFVTDDLRSNIVGLMTPVSTYIDWILNHIKRNSD